jgi:hypothetical protein
MLAFIGDETPLSPTLLLWKASTEAVEGKMCRVVVMALIIDQTPGSGNY